MIPVRGPSETVRENTGQEGAPAPPRPALGFFQVFPGSGLFGFCLRVSPRVLALDFRWVFHLEFLCGFCFCFVWGVPCGVNLHFIRSKERPRPPYRASYNPKNASWTYPRAWRSAGSRASLSGPGRAVSPAPAESLRPPLPLFLSLSSPASVAVPGARAPPVARARAVPPAPPSGAAAHCLGLCGRTATSQKRACAGGLSVDINAYGVSGPIAGEGSIPAPGRARAPAPPPGRA